MRLRPARGRGPAHLRWPGGPGESTLAARHPSTIEATPTSGTPQFRSRPMKRNPSLVFVAAPLALALILAGNSLAGGHSPHLASRAGRTDAEKLSAMRADAQRWLEDEQGGNENREHHRELRDVAWRASGGALDVDCGRNGGVIVTGWGRDSIRV